MTASKRSAKLQHKREQKLTLATTCVDLSKLRKASLRRYKKHFKLDVKADSKTELVEAVRRHFAQMPVRELDVAREFHSFWRLRAGRRVAAHASTLAAAAAAVVSAPAPTGARAAPPPPPAAAAAAAAAGGGGEAAGGR